MQKVSKISTIDDLQSFIISQFEPNIDNVIGDEMSWDEVIESYCDNLEMPLGMNVIRDLLPESEFIENDAAYVSDVLFKNPTHSLFTIAQVSTQASYRDYAKDLLLESECLAKALWSRLGNVCIDDDECIESSFLDFEIGVDRKDIWHWFEQQFNVAVVDLMGIA
jgi:hypothetical protein